MILQLSNILKLDCVRDMVTHVTSWSSGPRAQRVSDARRQENEGGRARLIVVGRSIACVRPDLVPAVVITFQWHEKILAKTPFRSHS